MVNLCAERAGVARMNRRVLGRGALWALLAVSVSSLVSCAGTGTRTSLTPMVEARAIGLADDARTDAIDSRWWHELNDNALTGLIERALDANPAVLVARARQLGAEASADLTAATNAPHVDGSLDITRQRFSEKSIYPPPLGGSSQTSATVRASAGWDADVFGKNRAALDAAIGAARAAQADAAAARIVVAASVAQRYVALARLVTQREIAARSLQQRQQLLDLVQQRVQSGLDSNVELRQSEGALPGTRVQIEAIDEAIALARHQLAALTAQSPEALATLTPTLPVSSNGAVPAHLGVDLLGRRPDVVAARWRVEAATLNVTSARAAFYPDVNLIAFVGFSSLGLDRLLDAGSREFGAGPALRLPLFDAGRLRANLRGRDAELDAAVNSYNGAVLEAVRDVVDQIASLQSIARQQQEQLAARASAESAYDLATSASTRCRPDGSASPRSTPATSTTCATRLRPLSGRDRLIEIAAANDILAPSPAAQVPAARQIPDSSAGRASDC